ncbi:MAG: hypothetical protein QM625_08035 [Ralstonia sp.]|uniref:Uncharacterized protein n=1 Tax=Ralstonia pickettii TaxID=329 RepID=A0A9Q3LSL2_RALPI|nr:hypothetical protein [Ralstonia pickettii]MBA9845634.1 hypothetical protein [Ralstonia pickettii]MBA9850922.1 hypothetical protein [Ralstonia pickettii]MBA9877808.1 hypothetical protein [Ralstonia pickettii]MBA9882391.1 hypothetical protein [Ralstonia pickettii]MBA9887617.1 hypothetical protein [Ralstonia pickettii]
MPIHFPTTLLIEEGRDAGGAALRLECESITVATGGITADGVEVRQLLALNWTPRHLSFESDGQAYSFDIKGVAVIRPSHAIFPFA